MFGRPRNLLRVADGTSKCKAGSGARGGASTSMLATWPTGCIAWRCVQWNCGPGGPRMLWHWQSTKRHAGGPAPKEDQTAFGATLQLFVDCILFSLDQLIVFQTLTPACTTHSIHSNICGTATNPHNPMSTKPLAHKVLRPLAPNKDQVLALHWWQS